MDLIFRIVYGLLIVISEANGLLPSSLLAQSTTFAHWDLIRGTNPNNDLTSTDCIAKAEASRKNIIYSNQYNGSESTSANGYNCFGGWESTLQQDHYVSYAITFGDDDAGLVEEFNFDVREYSGSHPEKITVGLLKNGVSVYEQEVVNGLGNTFQDVVVSFAGGSNFTSELGSTDVFEARIYAYGNTSTSTMRIGLDNIRFNGVCNVPGPSGVVLLGVGLLAGVTRRRR